MAIRGRFPRVAGNLIPQRADDKTFGGVFSLFLALPRQPPVQASPLATKIEITPSGAT